MAQPEASNLVRAMLQQQPAKRPTIQACLHHLFWWPAEKRLSLLIDLSNRMETEDREVRAPAGLSPSDLHVWTLCELQQPPEQRLALLRDPRSRGGGWWCGACPASQPIAIGGGPVQTAADTPARRCLCLLISLSDCMDTKNGEFR